MCGIAWLACLRTNGLKILGKSYTPLELKFILGIATFIAIFLFSSAATDIIFGAAAAACAVALHGAFRRPDS